MTTAVVSLEVQSELQRQGFGWICDLPDGMLAGFPLGEAVQSGDGEPSRASTRCPIEGSLRGRDVGTRLVADDTGTSGPWLFVYRKGTSRRH